MNISLRWLNRYLEPGTLGPLGADEAEDVLTHVGFPLESRTVQPDGDVLMDVEITSNRGDCLSHLGIAREIAAKTGRTLRPPSPGHTRRGGRVEEMLRLENAAPDVCPRFTAQAIRNVKIGPSPDWLRHALESVGQRSINNVVDVTNYLTFELGNPSHVFDLDRLAGRALVVRYARAGEPLKTLDGKQRTLVETDLVVADAERAQSLAGVMGGADSEVSQSTVNVALEVACWDPGTIRRAARRLGIRTDAGYRFERGVHPRTLDEAARRAAELLVQVAGGELCEGMLDAGRPLPEPRVIDLRPSRCAAIIGHDVPAGDMIALLRRLEIEVEQRDEDRLSCTIPPWRIDLEREIDLIEEVARIRGLDRIEVVDKLPMTVRPPQTTERAARELAATLTGMGFYETVTFSFVSPAQAAPFTRPGISLIKVDDERRGADGTLRPSVVPGLLLCRRANRAAQVEVPGGVRLFETAASFGQTADGVSGERRTLALLMDVPASGKKVTHDDRQAGIRLIRGSVESIARTLAGPRAVVRIDAARDLPSGWDPAASGSVTLSDGERTVALGTLGLVSRAALDLFELEHPVACAELDLEPLLSFYPPKAALAPLPAFPSIERDLSLVVAESLPWATFDQTLAKLRQEPDMALMEDARFVGVYRGEQAGKGRKSVTFRMRFRAPDRTLRHEEVDPQVARVVSVFKNEHGAELRA